MKNIDDFVEKLLQAKNLPTVNEAVRSEMKKDLSKRVVDRINAIIATHMPDDKLDEFEKLLDSKADDETVQNFCKEQIPDLQALITIELAKFQSIYLSK